MSDKTPADLPMTPEFIALCESGAIVHSGVPLAPFTVVEPECRYPCGCDQFPEEHCSCMDGHRVSKTPADVEILAEEFYLAVVQATADQWTEWQHTPQFARSGYYDLAYEVAEKVRPLMHMEALRDAAQAFPHGEFTADPTVPTWLRRRADLLDDLTTPTPEATR